MTALFQAEAENKHKAERIRKLQNIIKKLTKASQEIKMIAVGQERIYGWTATLILCAYTNRLLKTEKTAWFYYFYPYLFNTAHKATYASLILFSHRFCGILYHP